MKTFEAVYKNVIKENGCNGGETFARSMFEAGAKWQREQSYTEGQIKQAILDYCDENGMDDGEAKEFVYDFINNFLIKK